MKLSQVKAALNQVKSVIFELPNEKGFVPEHFHVTEVGLITKQFIDCGGTVREEKVINFQLWEAADYEHRLSPQKLSGIIEKSEAIFHFEDLEIEVEYQGETIGKYGLSFNGAFFQLTNKQTACLAEDACGIPVEKQKITLQSLGSKDLSTSCKPGGTCC